MSARSVSELRLYYEVIGSDLALADDATLLDIVSRRNHKVRHRSDMEVRQTQTSSRYFKAHGKRAGRRLTRRSGMLAKVCRSPKRLP
jgi:hypothetical protein